MKNNTWIAPVLCASATLIFTLYDVFGFGVVVSHYNGIVWVYRVLQVILECYLDGTLLFIAISNLSWSKAALAALIGWELVHFCFGCDWLFYVLQGIKFSGYTITWFPLSIPSLIFHALKMPFTGVALEWIGPCAVVFGLLVSFVIAYFD